MTVLLAYAGPTDLAVVAVILFLILPALLWAMLRPRPLEPMRRHELPPRPVEPRSNVRPLPGPVRPYDWRRDELLGEVWIAPVGTVIDETFPHGPEWSRLGMIEGAERTFLFESTTAKRP